MLCEHDLVLILDAVSEYALYVFSGYAVPGKWVGFGSRLTFVPSLCHPPPAWTGSTSI